MGHPVAENRRSSTGAHLLSIKGDSAQGGSLNMRHHFTQRLRRLALNGSKCHTAAGRRLALCGDKFLRGQVLGGGEPAIAGEPEPEG